MEYQLEEIEIMNYELYRIKYIFYKLVNYDGNEEKLKEYIKMLNDISCFNVDYRIYSNENNEVIIEKTIDTLD